MAKYMILTRDWKGSYDAKPKGWTLFGDEDEINTGQDCYAMIFCKGEIKNKISPQEIYDIWESLLCGEKCEYELDDDANKIMEEK